MMEPPSPWNSRAALVRTRSRSASSSSGGGTYRSAPGHLRPGHVLVVAHVAGETEDPLAEDVAHDLARPALDGVGPHAEEGLGDVALAAEPGLLGTHHLVAPVEHPGRTEEVD